MMGWQEVEIALLIEWFSCVEIPDLKKQDRKCPDTSPWFPKCPYRNKP